MAMTKRVEMKRRNAFAFRLDTLLFTTELIFDAIKLAKPDVFSPWPRTRCRMKYGFALSVDLKEEIRRFLVVLSEKLFTKGSSPRRKQVDRTRSQKTPLP